MCIWHWKCIRLRAEYISNMFLSILTQCLQKCTKHCLHVLTGNIAEKVQQFVDSVLCWSQGSSFWKFIRQIVNNWQVSEQRMTHNQRTGNQSDILDRSCFQSTADRYKWQQTHIDTLSLQIQPIIESLGPDSFTTWQFLHEKNPKRTCGICLRTCLHLCAQAIPHLTLILDANSQIAKVIANMFTKLQQ